MEAEGSLPCSQEPSTGPYPEPDQSSQKNRCLCTGLNLEPRELNSIALSYIYLFATRQVCVDCKNIQVTWNFVTRKYVC
jgi:hypothetical protein